MERSREYLKKSGPDRAWNDAIDTIFELVQRAGKTSKASAATETQDTVAVASTSASSVAWSRVTGKPSTFPPGEHRHEIADVSLLETTLATKMAASEYPSLVAIERLGGSSGFLKKEVGGSWILDASVAAPVESVFGRSGNVIAQAGDYSAYYLGITATAAAATKLETARTLTIGAASKDFDGSANVSWTLAEIGAIPASEKGSANGVAPLGTDSKIAAVYLPSYVDDVLEYANLAAFPATGESGKIYITIDTNKTYRWTGTVYSVISETIAIGETSSSAYRGDRGKIAYDHSQVVSGNPHGTTIAQISGLQTVLDAKLATVVADTASRAANTVYAAPNGSAGTATFRALAAADIPSLDTGKLTSGTLGYARGGTGISAPGATAGNLRWSGSAYTIDTASYALSSAIPAASSTTPAALGTAAAGTGTTWARADHVHAMPTAAQVGAAASSHNHTLDSLSNVTITSNASGEILRWNGTAWVNATLAEAGIQPAGSYVTTVFGRTGAVVAASGDYTTAQVTESGNLYYTDARVRAVALTGYAVGSNAALAATDTILAAFGKIQAQINARPGTVTSVGLSAAGPLSVAGSPVAGSGTLALAWSGSSSAFVMGDGSTNLFSRLNGASNIYNLNYGSGYIKFATVVIPGGSLTGYTCKWSLDGREVSANLLCRCSLTFAVRRSANNSFDAKLYCSELGGALTEEISVRTNDGITWDFYISTAGGYSTYYSVTPEMNGMPFVMNTFVASASMPSYSTVISASRYGFAHKFITARSLSIGGSSKSFDGTADVSWSLSEIGAVAASDVKQIYNWYSSRPVDCNLDPNGNGGIRSFKATSSMMANKPPQGDSHIIHLGWDNTGGYDTQLSVKPETGAIQMRGQNAGVWGAWRTVWDSVNLPISVLGNDITFPGLITTPSSVYIKPANQVTAAIGDASILFRKDRGVGVADEFIKLYGTGILSCALQGNVGSDISLTINGSLSVTKTLSYAFTYVSGTDTYTLPASDPVGVIRIINGSVASADNPKIIAPSGSYLRYVLPDGSYHNDTTAVSVWRRHIMVQKTYTDVWWIVGVMV